MDDPTKPAAKTDILSLDPALREKAKRWFAQAREQTERDDGEIASWRRRSSAGDSGSGGFSDDSGGDCGGSGD